MKCEYFGHLTIILCTKYPTILAAVTDDFSIIENYMSYNK